ncbi:MAG: glycogen/starch synthase, partial [Muribaculaceae bacterium]|nr:glycogen/starch synthase [Muribaculaceae bacterium]
MRSKKEQSSSIVSVSSNLTSEIGLLAETSWEVCNKIGGIYAVLSTKARQLKEQFGDSLIFIGPDVWTERNPSPYFKEKKTLLKNAASKLQLPWGITIRTGRWDIPGTPIVILVNPGQTGEHIDSVYAKVWEKYGVDSLHAYGDYDESCIFSVASAIVLKELASHLKIEDKKVLAHFDEWTTGMGLLYTQMTMPDASTVFTTHATSIGRSICGNGKPLYEYFRNYNGDQMAGELNMQSKHSLEKATAHAADCFTTVSEVTARECEQLLDIRPQVVTPNGFEPDFVPRTNKYNKLRRDGRQHLLDIAHALTGRHYGENTFLIATSGRLEYRNKGLDLFLDSIVTIEEQLPEDAEALAFVLVPGWVKEPSGSLLTTLKFNGDDHSGPDFLTHRLNNEDYDPVCCRIRGLNSENKGKKIKII